MPKLSFYFITFPLTEKLVLRLYTHYHQQIDCGACSYHFVLLRLPHHITHNKSHQNRCLSSARVPRNGENTMLSQIVKINYFFLFIWAKCRHNKLDRSHPRSPSRSCTVCNTSTNKRSFSSDKSKPFISL